MDLRAMRADEVAAISLLGAGRACKRYLDAEAWRTVGRLKAEVRKSTAPQISEADAQVLVQSLASMRANEAEEARRVEQLRSIGLKLPLHEHERLWADSAARDEWLGKRKAMRESGVVVPRGARPDLEWKRS